MSNNLVKRLLAQAGVAVLAGVLSSSVVWAEDEASVGGDAGAEVSDTSTGETGDGAQDAGDDVSDVGDNADAGEAPDLGGGEVTDLGEEPQITVCPFPVEVTIDVVECADCDVEVVASVEEGLVVSLPETEGSAPDMQHTLQDGGQMMTALTTALQEVTVAQVTEQSRDDRSEPACLVTSAKSKLACKAASH